MLTREHLAYRIREGRVRPAFVKRDDPDLLSVAERMVTTVRDFVGLERGAIEAALKATANAHPKPKIARGLAKLLIDRMDFGDAGEGAEELRESTFQIASRVLRALPDGADFETYERKLAEEIDIGSVRERLFSDLAEHRPLLSWRAIDAETLLDRYNLGLAQGLLLYTDQVTLELDRPEILEVRRVLGWLKFCRLVAWLERADQRWTITVEGPGAILSMQKKYGLQLATFLGAVPLLSRYRLSAPIDLPRKKTCMLELTRDDPLVSPFARTPGHLPEEVQHFVQTFSDDRWTIDPTPEVVQVGVRDVAVPDFTLQHREKGARLSVELFHRWHRAVLLRRIEALDTKPDPNLVLGVDRSLLDDELERKIEASDRMFVFNAFPSRRALEKVLAKIE